MIAANRAAASPFCGFKNGLSAIPWDDAHCLELARAGMESFGNLSDVTEMVTEIGKRYARGKGFEELQEAALDLEREREEYEQDERGRTQRFLKPQGFSATRWATYEWRAYRSILRAWRPAVALAADKRSEVTPVTQSPSADARRAEDFFEKLTSSHCVTGCVGLADVSKSIGAMSLALQTVGLPPWVRRERCRATIATLRRDCNTLERFAKDQALGTERGDVAIPAEAAHSLPTLCEALPNLCKKQPTFGDVPLCAPADRPDEEPSAGVTRALGDICKWALGVCDRIEERLQPLHPWAILAGDCFDASSMATREPDAGELKKFGELCAESAQLPALSGVHPAAMMIQYLALRSSLRGARDCESSRWQLNGQSVDPIALYRDVFTCPAFYHDAKDLVFLIEYCFLIGGVESVCESMASTYGRQAEPGSSAEKVAKRCVINWSSPPAYAVEADEIIAQATSKLDFFRKSPQSKLAQFTASRVIDRLVRPSPVWKLFSGNPGGPKAEDSAGAEKIVSESQLAVQRFV